MIVKELTKKIEKLPLQKQKEVENFVDFLSKKNSLMKKSGKKKKLAFKWEGALADLRKKYTSVQLQHKIWDDVAQKYAGNNK